MPWTESASSSFICRHSSTHPKDAARVLALLERTRERLNGVLPSLDHEPAIVLHDTPHALVASNPLMPAVWAATARPARRYVTGWQNPRELHVLSGQALRERAASVSGSYEMLALSPASLYAKRVIAASNRDLREARLGGRIWHGLRWAWLLEGASRWLSGESGYGRSVAGGYLRGGHRPHFPPGPRDAPLLAPSLIELLVEQHGERALASLVSRLHSDGAEVALSGAFSGQAIGTVENEWRSRLRQMADGEWSAAAGG
jgi:hypothetical protein